MVARAEPDAVPRLQGLQRLDIRKALRGVAVNDIARADDQVCTDGVRLRDYRLSTPARRRRRNVNVRELENAVAVERGRQRRAVDLYYPHVGDLHAVPDSDCGKRPREHGEEIRPYLPPQEEERDRQDKQDHRARIHPVPQPYHGHRQVRVELVAAQQTVEQELRASEKDKQRPCGLRARAKLEGAARGKHKAKHHEDEGDQRKADENRPEHFTSSSGGSRRPWPLPGRSRQPCLSP